MEDFDDKQAAFKGSSTFLDIGGLLKKGLGVLKKGVEAYVGWLSPKVEAALDALEGREPLEKDVSRIRQLIEDDKRHGSTVLAEKKEEEIVSDERPYLGEKEGTVLGESEEIESREETGSEEPRSEEPRSEETKDDEMWPQDPQEVYARLSARLSTGGGFTEADRDIVIKYLRNYKIEPTGDMKKDILALGKATRMLD